MKSFRALFRDRLCAGVLAGASGWLLVLNLFVAALSCGMTVQAEAGPSFVLCEPGSPVLVDGSDAAGHFSHDCPYVIGHDGDALLLAAVAPGADLGSAFEIGERIAHGPAPTFLAPIDPGRLGLAPAPRGPPRLSA